MLCAACSHRNVYLWTTTANCGKDQWHALHRSLANFHWFFLLSFLRNSRKKNILHIPLKNNIRKLRNEFKTKKKWKMRSMNMLLNSNTIINLSCSCKESLKLEINEENRERKKNFHYQCQWSCFLNFHFSLNVSALFVFDTIVAWNFSKYTWLLSECVNAIYEQKKIIIG